MQPLSPEELSKYAQQFRTQDNIIARGQGVAEQINLELARTAERNDESGRAIVLEALAHAVVSNLNRYVIGADLPVLAWITRNIFELEIILAFVTASPDNLKSFRGRHHS